MLNTIYKLFACIVQERIADKLDRYLQKTQYGFRKKRGTADALHYIRRMVDKGEMTGAKTLLVLLDWEKAFDKVIHEKLIIALERMNIPRKLVALIRDMYSTGIHSLSWKWITSNRIGKARKRESDRDVRSRYTYSSF